MNIFGINSSRAAPPRVDPQKSRPVADGGAALLIDGQVSCAAIEERFTRIRYAGGFRESARACLEQSNLDWTELDAIGHSTCCDSIWSSESDVIDDIVENLDGRISRAAANALRGKLVSVDHHQSHAALAFGGSGFRRALVVVADGMGNRKGPAGEFDVSATWWRGSFHRHNYFLCEWNEGRIRFDHVHEDGCGAEEIGLGEVYRGVTHYLGWQTYQHAGKVMALAAFGDPSRLGSLRLIDFVPPMSVRVRVPNLHCDPVRQIESAIRGAGHPIPEKLQRPASPDDAFMCDVAALVQEQLQSSLCRAVSALADEHGADHVVFGGGVSMNCVALGKLAVQRPDLRLYVPPAPSDTGLALGNALWVAYAAQSPVSERAAFSGIQSAALGVAYGHAKIDGAVSKHLQRNPRIVARRHEDEASLIETLVNDLAAGKVVGLRQGRAEYGPRALGNSSLLADPRSKEMRDAVNSFKRREPFRPYAPSILSEHVADYFEIDTPSPFMSFAGQIRPERQHRVPAVVHVDGSARYQSVEPNSGFYRRLLEAWHRASGVPVLLNTSFNLDGQPIVETPEDALACFEHSGLPVLVLGRWRLEQH